MLQEGVRGGAQDDQRCQQMLSETPPAIKSIEVISLTKDITYNTNFSND